MTTDFTINLKTCHGCNGKGWVDTQKGAQICPICYGKGYLNVNGYEVSPITWMYHK